MRYWFPQYRFTVPLGERFPLQETVSTNVPSLAFSFPMQAPRQLSIYTSQLSAHLSVQMLPTEKRGKNLSYWCRLKKKKRKKREKKKSLLTHPRLSSWKLVLSPSYFFFSFKFQCCGLNNGAHRLIYLDA